MGTAGREGRGEERGGWAHAAGPEGSAGARCGYALVVHGGCEPCHPNGVPGTARRARTWRGRRRGDAREQDAHPLDHRQQHAAKHSRLARAPQARAQLQEAACGAAGGGRGQVACRTRLCKCTGISTMVALHMGRVRGPAWTPPGHCVRSPSPCCVPTRQRSRRDAVPRVLLLAQRHQRAVKGGEQAAPHRKAAADAWRLPPDGLQQEGWGWCGASGPCARSCLMMWSLQCTLGMALRTPLPEPVLP